MITQNVSAKKISPLKGLIIVVAIAALIILGSFAGNIVAGRFGAIWGQITLILIAGAAALYIMRNVVVEYQYTVSDSVFYIERVYGKRSKVMLQIPLEDILYIGSREKAREKWPSARNMATATVKGNITPVVTVAYRVKGEICLIAVQPDEEMKKAMFDPEKRARAASEKWGE
ncbi:MAG: hypothetical protein Q4D04_07170 [Clostridia bacterium]|nr:hypothetical protein [Clostridia bacterium]